MWCDFAKDNSSGSNMHHVSSQVRISNSQDTVPINKRDNAHAFEVEPLILLQSTEQPAFAQANRLNENTRSIEQGDGKPSGCQSARKHLLKDEDCNARAREGREQPYHFQISSAPSAKCHECTVQVGKSNGQDKRTDEREVDRPA